MWKKIELDGGINRYQLKKTWSKLTIARATKNEVRLTNGGVLHDSVFEVLCLIAFAPNVTLAQINTHPYFDDKSLSHVKRCVGTLINEGLVTATTSEEDLRERLLNVVEYE